MEYPVEKGMELKFMTAGKAIFTLRSSKTGARYTYKVTKHKENEVWFIKLLVGNTRVISYVSWGYFKGGLCS